MNKVILMGRLTADPDVGGSDEKKYARYKLAVDRRGKNAEGADFISCVAFGRGADFAEKYLKKGTKIVLSGRIQTGKFTNKEGKEVYTTDVIAEDQEFAESKNSGGQQAPPAEAAPGGDGFMNIPDGISEELPFN